MDPRHKLKRVVGGRSEDEEFAGMIVSVALPGPVGEAMAVVVVSWVGSTPSAVLVGIPTGELVLSTGSVVSGTGDVSIVGVIGTSVVVPIGAGSVSVLGGAWVWLVTLTIVGEGVGAVVVSTATCVEVDCTGMTDMVLLVVSTTGCAVWTAQKSIKGWNSGST